MNIVGILGSPSLVSRSGSLLQLAQSHLREVASSLHTVSVRDLPAEALLHAQWDDAQIRQALQKVQEAQVILVCTPIYKAAYSGLLKAFLDLLPQDGLRGKSVLPLATGGSMAHLLALDYGLKPVLSALGAREILDSVYATDQQIAKHETQGYLPGPEVHERVSRALQTVVHRAEVFQREEQAARRERDAAAARSQVHESWQARDVRWST